MDGLKRRDTFVLGLRRERNTPLVVIFAGGYATDFKDTVEAHCQTIRLARTLL